MRRQGKHEEADVIAGVTETKLGSGRGDSDDDAVDEEERGMRGRRRARFSHWAKRKVSSTLSLHPAPENNQDCSISDSKGKTPFRSIDLAHRMRSTPSSGTD